MDNFDCKKHWEQIYQSKGLKEVSWYQAIPEVSLDFLKQFHIPHDASIIDVGGGGSLLVDHLLELGYTNVTVLDISEAALQVSQHRLGDKASQVKWIAADVTSFVPTVQYHFWHDRASFHFLTDEVEISIYLETVQRSLAEDGILVIGTFSEEGPEKCSGIRIRQYSGTSMTERVKLFFEKIRCIAVEHQTPFDTIQHVMFCSFRKWRAA